MSAQGLAVLLVLVNAAVIYGQIPSFGRCPDFPVVGHFAANKYLGKWYEIEKYFTIFELGGTCITATYTDLGNGTIGVFNAMTEMLSRKRRTISGTAVLDDPSDGQAKLSVTFPSIPFSGKAPYWVLDTDYDNYSVVWSCNNLALFNFQIVWFLSRSRNPTEEVRKKVYHTMESLGLSTNRLQVTEQTKCPETY
ncbi:unnamed protein product [Allacma fusca]|uniref:Apolipoprotein D n=1 Tax=Allacma fusca TaxID=39272 RepID=A0A8J2MFS2_9HEXA|nr:unnamed protein product [Allacma fusca]